MPKFSEQQVTELLRATREHALDERADFLHQACGEDEALCLELELLLAKEQSAANPLSETTPQSPLPNLTEDQGLSLVGRQLGNYYIQSFLGGGGMAKVYLAQDSRLGRTDALKILPPEFSSDEMRMHRFLREARAASTLNHPNIATIYEVGESDGIHFIAMEYVEGETLADRIKSRPLDFGEAIEIGLQVADALDEAHSKGVIHRDIKPANLMFTPRGRVKVLDFGLAKVFSPADKMLQDQAITQTSTEPGVVVGTLLYMSPEQILGKEVDQRTDLFSLGTVLYEMATGQPPFLGNNRNDTTDRILHSRPLAISRFNYDVTPEFERIVRKCLEKDREKRYQSAKDLRIDLQEHKQEAVHDPTDKNDGWKVAFRSMVKAIPKLLKKSRWTWLLALVLAVLLLPALREWFSGIFAPGLPRHKHVVVLPFTNVGGEASNKPLCDGLLETITARLTQLQQPGGTLWVVPAHEVIKSGIDNLPKAKTVFGANLAITGSLQRYPESIRFILNLEDVETPRVLKSDLTDYPLTQLQALQDQVAAKLAKMLELEFLPDLKRLQAAERTQVSRAYEYYLEARGYLLEWQKEGNIDQAIYTFQEALKVDPGYASAYAGLGEACWYKYDKNRENVLWVEKAKVNCQRALQLNDQLAPVHVTLGLIQKGTGQYDSARVEFQKALELEPMSETALTGLASAYDAQGDLAQAEATYRKAIELKQDYWGGYHSLGLFFYKHNRYKEAIPQFERVVALTPDNVRAYNNLGAIYMQLEQWEKAREMLQRAFQLQLDADVSDNLATVLFHEGKYAEALAVYQDALNLDDKNYEMWGNLGSGYLWTGDTGKADESYRKAIQLAEARLKVNPRDPELLADLSGYYGVLGERAKAEELIQRAAIIDPENSYAMYRAALNYEHWGEREKALHWIEKAIEHGYSKAAFQRSPELKALRGDPRYISIFNQPNVN
jgi:serine/threonine protein kinase/Flp pilus assembly protein TadD